MLDAGSAQPNQVDGCSGLFKTSLEAEILALRHQLNVLRQTSPRRPVFSNFDRIVFVCLYRQREICSGAVSEIRSGRFCHWPERIGKEHAAALPGASRRVAQRASPWQTCSSDCSGARTSKLVRAGVGCPVRDTDAAGNRTTQILPVSVLSA
jgi:hypothetical protein